MYQKQDRIITKKEGRVEDLEAGPMDNTQSGLNVEVAARAGNSRDGSEIELIEHSRP